MEEIRSTEKSKFDIYPSKTSRRLLVFLADIFICLIVNILLFEFLVLPLGKLIINYNDSVKAEQDYTAKREDILYENNLLHFDTKKESFEISLDYTSEQFMKYYVFNDSSSENNEVFYNYFVTIKGLAVSEVNKKYEELGSEYFTKDSLSTLGTYKFKTEYIDGFKPYFVTGDEMSSDYASKFNEFKKDFFLNTYAVLLNDVKDNDLTATGIEHSYNKYTELIRGVEDSFLNLYVISAYISFFIGISVLFFLIPLLNHKGRTIAEIILKIEHVDKKTIHYLKKRFVLVEGLFNSLSAMTLLFLVPFVSLNFTSLFALPLLYLPSVVCVLISIMQLILILVTDLNTSLKEIGTNSIVVDTQLIDEYYRAMNYGK